MGYLKETYANDLLPVLKDWLTDQVRGQSVENLPLSLSNRAIKNLWIKKPWSDLATDLAVTLSGGAFVLPADFGRIVSLWGDLSGTGVPSYWYYAADIYEKGYKIRDSFLKATGHSWTISFYYPQAAGINLIYQRTLEDLVGAGTEYLYFPANLILLEVQKINSLENGNTKEYMAFSAMFDEIYRDYCNAHQWVNYDPTPRLNDRNGNQVVVESYSLDGSGSSGYSPLPNSYLR